MKIRDFSVWESFYWVARDQSFTKAAHRLGIGVPFLSKKISLLEDKLGVRLFTRTTRKVNLTHDGQGIFPRVKVFLEDAQALEDQFQQQDAIKGIIRISCLTAFATRVMAPLLVEFSRLHPFVTFEIEASDILVDLIDSQIDIAIRVQEPMGSEFIFKKLMENKLVLCASPSYIQSLKTAIHHPEDLYHHPILALKVYEKCKFLNCPITIGELTSTQKIFCQNGLILSELACQGAGIAVRSIWDVQSLFHSGRLVEVLPDFSLDSFGYIYAVIPTRRLLAHRVRVFLDFLSEKAKDWEF